MQNEPQLQQPVIKKRRLMYVGLMIALFIVAIVCTVLVLKGISPKQGSSSLSMTVTAKETVALYRVPGAISSLSDKIYDQQLYDGSNVPIVYKLPERGYSISTPTSYNVLFYAKNSSSKSDIPSVQNQTDTFMKDKGYARVSNTVDSQSSSLTYATYASENTVCQLISSSDSNIPESVDVPNSHQLACSEKEAINGEYKRTETLFTVYKQSKQLPDFTMATRTTIVEGDKSLAIVKLKNTTQKSPTLLFAAVDDTWLFIADLNGRDGESNGKYVITPDIKTKLEDPKYDGLLAKYIIGQNT